MKKQQLRWFEIEGLRKDGHSHRYTTRYAAQAVVDRMIACGYDQLHVVEYCYE